MSQPCIGYLELADSVENNKNFAGHLHQLLHNPFVEGILLVIDSGGGAVVDSFKLANMIKLANQQKPIVTYVSDTCASGAYLIACESSCIVASAMADIGSIGVAIEITKKRAG